MYIWILSDIFYFAEQFEFFETRKFKLYETFKANLNWDYEKTEIICTCVVLIIELAIGFDSLKFLKNSNLRVLKVSKFKYARLENIKIQIYAG